MAEWSNAAVLKTVELIAPGVRIPLPPPGQGWPVQIISSVIDWGDIYRGVYLPI
jgi:hypothetical protein